MNTIKETINGNSFLIRTWEIEHPKAHVFIVHGYAEHSGRYAETAEILNEAGFSVHAFDRRGEGASEGRRAVVNDFSVQVEDLKSMLERIDVRDQRLFLFGHSLGGLIATKYIIDHNAKWVDGLLLSGPLLMPDEDMSPFLQKIAGFVGRVLPFLPVVKVDTALVTQVAAERRAYDEDALVYHGATKARTAFEFLRTMKKVQKDFSKITLPFIVMHGGADKLTNPKGSHALFDQASSEDKTIKIFEGWYHEIMREPGKELFFRTVVNWLNARV